MKITRRFTTPGQNVYDTVEWTKRTSRITNADGSVVFEMKDADVPRQWSQLATDIMVSKYFRKAGVPEDGGPNNTAGSAGVSPARDADSRGRDARTPHPNTGPERSVRQVVHRLAGCWKHWGETHGYFDTAEDAQAFYDELAYMLLHQMAAPNSPQWFNTGLNWAYGISGPAQGHFICDPETGEVSLAHDAYTHPQPHACFIQSVKDDLVAAGGIMDLWTREARLFKYGSGTGTNFSGLRGEGEPLSGGGTSSGLMSWLRIGDRAAGAIKSGGTTRRAAKMVCLDADHPDIENFVNWKVREELKVAALVEGLKHLQKDQKELAASLGLKLTYDFNGEAYYTVSGQNSNNSVRLTDAFFKAVESDGEWHLRRRIDGKISKTLKAKDLWNQICRAAWRCADPGVQYDSTINAWHTCPNSGRINASNPCCFVGETLVETQGGPIRIDELVAMHERGERLPLVNSVDFKKQKSVRRAILRAWKAGDARHLVRVETYGGLNVLCTPEHRWYAADGTAVRADQLSTELRLCAVGHMARERVSAHTSTPGGADDPCLEIENDRVRAITMIETAEPVAVYDIEVEETHNFAIRSDLDLSTASVIVSNSEYMFLDDTACNLASINMIQFYNAEQRHFDLDGYEHAINLWTIVLEISVLMAAFPSEEIARQSYRFRTLGLGYANLGAMLMQAGIPYDSEDARAICGALTAILTGRSYAMSAQMASELQPFPGFVKNREAMMRVIRNHRRAAHGVSRESDAYEGLEIKPVPIDQERFEGERMNLANADGILDRATRAWDEALELGQKYGFRNAQVTVIAPTGTIGLLMDCDTTGVEPDFALVKFKKLAGGGYFKIANASLRPALKSLGYDPKQIDEIVKYVMGTLSIETPLAASMQSSSKTFRDFLHSRGYNSQELIDIENSLPTVFELAFAFNAWSMPARVLKAIGVDPEKAKNDPTFNGLKALGLTARQIDELNRVICGTQTVEGAPHLKQEHLPVFDCANKCGAIGKRFIAPQGHIRMMAAAQPFISGAISKTINLPQEASVEDIAAAYWLSWELGLKANALYRDNSKLSQPLNTKSDSEDEDDENAEEIEAALGEVSTEVVEAARVISTSLASSDSNGESMHEGGPTLRVGTHDAERRSTENPEPQYLERIVERIIERPMRRRLPDTRHSITHHFNVAGHEGYLTVGMYDDHTPGELFITMSKEGSTIGGLMDSLGTAISVALQYGVPIESLVTKFAHQRFEPMGMTTNHDIPFAKSLVDYIFRWMGMEFIKGYREANAPARNGHGKANGEAAPARDAIHANKPKEEKSWSRTDMDADGATPLMNAASRIANQISSRIVETTDRERTDVVSSRPRTGHGVDSDASLIEMIHTEHSTKVVSESTVAVVSALDQSNAALMGDAPACDGCGSITVRNGTCYKCMNCGNSMGCS